MLKTAIASLGLVSALAGVASANTVRNYTGHECQTHELQVYGECGVDGCNYLTYSTIGYWAAGCVNVSNDTTPACDDPVRVVLPISGNQSSTVDVESVQVSVYDGTDEAQITCEVVVVSQSGGTFVSSVVGSGVATTGYTTLDFGPAQLGRAGGAIASARSFHVSCSIPSRNHGSSGSCHQDQYSTVAGYSVETVNP